MDLQTVRHQLREDPLVEAPSSPISMADQVEALVQETMQLWWRSQHSFPTFPYTYLSEEQAAQERQLDRLANGLIKELKQMPAAPAERQAWQERLRPALLDFAQNTFHLQAHHLRFIENSGIIETNRAFARAAREFDPAIQAEDIYQASRNVMSMNIFQLLLGQPVELTPSVFAYSMLYPYSDNYIDDPAIPNATKHAFNQRFQECLTGSVIRPQNQHEEKICQLIRMIENQWERARYPQVYESLLAIHTAQVRSLALIAPNASPFEFNVLGGSFEKGGTSVLADAYLVAGQLSVEQARFAFGYGSFTQLMDDLEDLQSDQREGQLTLFTQTAGRWPLDRLTNQMFHFGRNVLKGLADFHSPATPMLTELFNMLLDPVLVQTVGQAERNYNKSYLRAMEQHIPFRLSSLRRQREKFTRQKFGPGQLLESLL